MKRFLVFAILIPALVLPVGAQTIRWVDFDVPYESMKYALQQDILTAQQEKHISWIDTLALAACRTGDVVAIQGRLQSRVYTKQTEEGSAQRTAYEISALSAQIAEDPM